MWIWLLAAFAACSPAPSDPPAAKDPVPFVAPEPPKRPAADSFNSAILDRMEAELSQLVSSGKVANVTFTLVKNGETVRAGAFGTRTLGGTDPVDAHTIYRIYSMTKPVTAVAMMMLVEEGRIGLDDPITDYLPELSDLKVVRNYGAVDPAGIHPVSRTPTIRELLSHTAGFGYGDGRQDYVNRKIQSRKVDTATSSDGFLSLLARIPLMYEPGTAWSYSVASDLQGIIIERVSGESLGAFMKRRIFDPLDMPDTGFSVSETQRPRLADLTAWTPEQPMRVLGGAMASMDAAGLPREAGGHGLVSTLADYQKFAQMLLNEGSLDSVTLLKPESVQLMRTNVLTQTDPETGLPKYEPMRGVGYGFGVAMVTDTIRSGLAAPDGTFFWDGAAGTWFWVDPRDHILFVGMLQNFSASPVRVRTATMRNVYHAHFSDYVPEIKDIPSAREN